MRRKVLSIQKLGYMILLFPLIEPEAAFERISLLNIVFNMWKLCSWVLIFILYIDKCRKIDKFTFAVVSCCFIELVSTVFHGGWIYSSLLSFVRLTAMVLLIKMMLDEDPMFCFDVVLPLLEILLYANLISIILFPDGLYTDIVGADFERSENWILGVDNAQTPYFIAALSVAIIRDYYKLGELKLSFRSWMLIGVCYGTVLIRKPATALVGLFIILPAILLPKLFTKSRILNIVTYMTVIIVFFFAIIIFRTQNHFAFLIQGVLHKSLTFSGRTRIWDNAISVILHNPLLGIGTWNEEVIWSYLGQIHAHNIFLQVLVSGGILEFSFFVYMHIIIARKLIKNNHNGIACFLAVVVFSMLIMNQMEIHQTGIWFFTYELAFNSDKIILQQRKYPCKKNKIRNSVGFDESIILCADNLTTRYL